MLVNKTTLIAAAVILTATVVSISAVKTKHARANAPVTAASLREGLVLDMPFDQDEAGSGVITDSSGKTKGGKITDHSGQGNHGVAAGVRWTPDGKRGGAYEFTDDGDEIVISNNPSLNPKQLTLAAWIKTSYTDAHLAAHFRQILHPRLRPQHRRRLWETNMARPGQPGDGTGNPPLYYQKKSGGRAMASSGGHL